MPGYSPTQIWQGWNGQYQTGVLGNAATASIQYQVQVTGTASTDTNVQVWTQWNEQAGLGQYQNHLSGNWNTQPELTPEEVAANQATNRVLQEAARLEQIRVNQAVERAEELLMMFLTPKQKDDYKERGYFDTEVNDSRYRLYRGRAGNVRKLHKDGREEIRMCVHPEPYLPDHDNVLAQLLALQTDEATLVRTANHTRLI